MVQLMLERIVHLAQIKLLFLSLGGYLENMQSDNLKLDAKSSSSGEMDHKVALEIIFPSL